MVFLLSRWNIIGIRSKTILAFVRYADAHLDAFTIVGLVAPLLVFAVGVEAARDKNGGNAAWKNIRAS